mmetsp:Transcript_28219/g.90946  ORF Transcript_28219/g.90946 Transcript_28219/m.90946 type:complete len:211 (+) Transcript_28219:494-1126(+)
MSSGRFRLVVAATGGRRTRGRSVRRASIVVHWGLPATLWYRTVPLWSPHDSWARWYPNCAGARVRWGGQADARCSVAAGNSRTWTSGSSSAYAGESLTKDIQPRLTRPSLASTDQESRSRLRRGSVRSSRFLRRVVVKSGRKEERKKKEASPPPAASSLGFGRSHDETTTLGATRSARRSRLRHTHRGRRAYLRPRRCRTSPRTSSRAAA